MRIISYFHEFGVQFNQSANPPAGGTTTNQKPIKENK